MKILIILPYIVKCLGHRKPQWIWVFFLVFKMKRLTLTLRFKLWRFKTVLPAFKEVILRPVLRSEGWGAPLAEILTQLVALEFCYPHANSVPHHRWPQCQETSPSFSQGLHQDGLTLAQMRFILPCPEFQPTAKIRCTGLRNISSPVPGRPPSLREREDARRARWSLASELCMGCPSSQHLLSPGEHSPKTGGHALNSSRVGRTGIPGSLQGLLRLVPS
jgi:hypothetical protein